MKIGFTGTRRGLSPTQHNRLAEYLKSCTPIEEAHHGSCIGADEAFHHIIASNHPGTLLYIHPPRSREYIADLTGNYKHPPLGYIARNHNIVDATDLLVACPSDVESVRSGTWATVRYARSLKRPHILVWPDGNLVSKDYRKELTKD